MTTVNLFAGDWERPFLKFGQTFTACEHCGGMRRTSPHPHAPRWVLIDGQHKRVDCRGVEVSP